MKKILSLCLALGMIFLMGCGSKSEKPSNEAGKEVPKSNVPTVTIHVKDMGDIVVEMDPKVAPNTVKNFMSLSNQGFYDGLIFHRVIKGFMIQGGDPNGDGSGDAGYSIKGEFEKNGVKNPLSHVRGVISMARQPDNNNSAGSQFFILQGDADYLDGEYAAFGKVISGMDVVDKIAEVKTGAFDKPEEDVVIESVDVDAKGFDYSTVEKIEPQ